jgi:hypothetical protein
VATKWWARAHSSARRDGVATDPGRDGRDEGAVQLAAVDGQLRPPMACGAAAGFTPDQLPTAVIEDQFAGGHSAGGQLIEQAQLVEFANGVGQQVHPDPKGLQTRRGFEYRDAAESCGVQAQCCSQPTDSGADITMSMRLLT